MGCPMGAVSAWVSERGVCGVALNQRVVPYGRSNLLRAFMRELERYFAGKPVSFRFPLHMEPPSPFTLAVWDTVRRIPAGEVRTYGQVAEAAGYPGASRAVGNAMRRNPLPLVIPCHRVVASNRGLGGFAAGLEWKAFLLRCEGNAARC